MYIDSSAPVVQLSKDQHILTTLVVLGPGHNSASRGHLAGSIKPVNFGPHTQSTILGPVDYVRRQDRIVGVKAVHLSADEMTKGSRFLRDMLVDEGRLVDYQAIVSWYQAIANGRPVAPLPDSYLPKKALEWRTAQIGTDIFALPLRPEDEPAEPEPEAAPVPALASTPVVRRKAATADSPGAA